MNPTNTKVVIKNADSLKQRLWETRFPAKSQMKTPITSLYMNNILQIQHQSCTFSEINTILHFFQELTQFPEVLMVTTMRWTQAHKFLFFFLLWVLHPLWCCSLPTCVKQETREGSVGANKMSGVTDSAASGRSSRILPRSETSTKPLCCRHVCLRTSRKSRHMSSPQPLHAEHEDLTKGHIYLNMCDI